MDDFDAGMDVIGGTASDDRILDELDDEWNETLDDASLRVLCEGATAHNLAID
jgi:hypothetical protein